MNNDEKGPRGKGGGVREGDNNHKSYDERQRGYDDGYEVGYRRPPKNTRFVKGTSGNPKGRPKGTANLSTLIAKSLRRKVAVRENGHERIAEAGEVIVASLTNKAMKGDLTVSRFLFERLEAAHSQENVRHNVSTPTTEIIDRDDRAVIEAYFNAIYGGAKDQNLDAEPHAVSDVGANVRPGDLDAE